MSEQIRALRWPVDEARSRPATAASRGGDERRSNELIVLVGHDAGIPDGFLEVATDRISADPRVASVSWANAIAAALSGAHVGPFPTGDLPPAAEAYASEPAGTFIVVNPLAFDLTGDLWDEDGNLTPASCRDWAARANQRGLRHVWRATAHGSDQAVATELAWPPAPTDVEESRDGTSAIAVLLRGIGPTPPLTIAVEADWLGPHQTGAQVALVCWLESLAARDDVAELRLHHLPGGRIPEYATHLDSLPKIRVMPSLGLGDPADIFWRPQQPIAGSVSHGDRELGRRIVVTVLDMIEYSNRRYHANEEAWRLSRRAFRSYVRQVDGVTAISADVRDHVSAEVPGLSESRLFVTSLGVEHLARQPVPEQVPADLSPLFGGPVEEQPFLLVLGNDYLHKNRDFAIRAWKALAEEMAVDLVLAGLHVGAGSSSALERALRGVAPSNDSRLITLGAVSSESKNWLLSHASVVLYPTSAEGFGFIPFEAATFGVPTCLTAFGPISENLGRAEGLTTWSLEAYVAAVRQLLQSAEARDAAVAEVRRRSTSLTWESAADALMAAFRATFQQPPQPMLPVPWSEGCGECGLAEE